MWYKRRLELPRKELKKVIKGEVTNTKFQCVFTCISHFNANQNDG